MRFFSPLFVLSCCLICLVISCSGSNSGGNQPEVGPQVQSQSFPNTDYTQITLSHSIQSGELNWTLKILDDQDNEITSDKEDQCELQALNVGSQVSVSFKENLRTPFCSNFEIDPISTIDNISIIAPNQKIEVCLNNVCNRLSLP